MKIVLASNNAHKLEELRAILSTLGMDVVPQKEMNINIEPDENGTTFEENSYIKAKTIMDACGLPTIADDSGLMVEALGGEPGVYSARYGGESCVTDRDRLNYLLKKMEGETNRNAKFVSVITMLTPDGKKIVARGECPGTILHAYRGNGGFGYDPLFYYAPFDKTYAEMNLDEKNKISHRANAMQLFIAEFKKILPTLQ